MQSYWIDVQNGTMTFANPNLSAILAFLHTNEEVILIPLFLLTAAILIFTAIWRSTRPDVAQEPEPPAPLRIYTVKRGGDVVFEVKANDVDLDLGDPNNPFLNFLSDKHVDDDLRATVAIIAWDPEYRVESKPA